MALVDDRRYPQRPLIGVGAPEYHYAFIDYMCRAIGGTLAPGDDVCAVEWVRRRDLPKLQITEGTLAVIEKAFR